MVPPDGQLLFRDWEKREHDPVGALLEAEDVADPLGDDLPGVAFIRPVSERSSFRAVELHQGDGISSLEPSVVVANFECFSSISNCVE